MEYPTGIFADKYGRKLSIIFSILLNAVALIIEVTAHTTTQFFIGAVFIGASFAFSSGAREALIYDSLKEKKLEKSNSKVLGSLDTVGAIGGILSALVGSMFFTLKNTLPYWLTIGAYGLSLFFFIFIREPKYKKEGEIIDTLKNFKEGIKLVWKNPVLKSLLLLYIPLFFFEEAWYNAQQPILIGLGLPILFLGTYQAAKTIFFALGGVTLPKLLDKFSHKTLLFSIIIIEFLVWLILGFNNLYAVIIFAYILFLLHQFWNYVDADIIHEHISSHVRATTLSARQMLISLVWIFNPWVMGYLVNTFSRNILFPIFGVIILIVALSIFISRKRYF
ncbi:MFS transporter [Candidatus Woesearchaeota archaeon]|nr:MFS transporter [Candidatus Woesearchaeota archaeon]